MNRVNYPMTIDELIAEAQKAKKSMFLSPTTRKATVITSAISLSEIQSPLLAAIARYLMTLSLKSV